MRKLSLLMISAALLPATSAIAQGYDQGPPPGYNDPGPPPGYNDQGPPPGGDDQGPPPGYSDQGPPPGSNGQGPPPYGDRGPPPGYGDDQGPPPGYADQGPPQGYDGSQPPPPPPGYRPDADYAAQQADDRGYSSYAEQWAQDNCVKAHGNVGEGAALGGVIGAIIGSGFAGRHDRGAGLVAGGALGAVGGAAIAANSGSNATSPGCPPGFVVRNGAPAFAYGGGAFLYDSPGWYRPWYFYGGHWLYRPYPYHRWYYRNYHGRGDRWNGRGGRGDGHRRDWHDR